MQRFSLWLFFFQNVIFSFSKSEIEILFKIYELKVILTLILLVFLIISIFIAEMSMA